MTHEGLFNTTAATSAVIAFCCALMLCILGADANAAETAAASSIADLSLEELSNIVVTSVSRREERLADAPAAIFVITADDIRRSGATSLPEALRLAPNLEIARADANQYAISARGFNNVLANKMLVLIDGRIVYTPLFSGVFWEAQQVMLGDIDRIEVISGPGTTLWGTNAVNGVINVITKDAKATQGTLVDGGGGNKESIAALRYGGISGAGGPAYRAYGMYTDRSNTDLTNGTPVRDASHSTQGGFRIDWTSPAQTFTLEGDAYQGTIDQQPSARDLSGLNVLGRYSTRTGDGGDVVAQAYYDRTERNHPGTFREALNTFDVEFEHRLAALGQNRVIWGAGVRYSQDNVENSAAQAFIPPDRSLTWAHVFVQDDYAIRPDLDLIAGVKMETNDYTGVEWLPNIRLAWRPSSNQLAWTAFSRAVRAPSRIDRDFYSPGVPPYFLIGSDRFVSEIANVYELGYRAQPIATLSFNINAFYDDNRRLRSLAPTPAGAQWANDIEGSTTGIEAWATWQATPWWRLVAGVTALRQRLAVNAGAVDLGGLATLGNDPNHWWLLRSSMDLPYNLELDVLVRGVGALPNPVVPAYTAADARLGWHATPSTELWVKFTNLFDPGHAEWGAPAARVEFERAFFVGVRWQM